MKKIYWSLMYTVPVLFTYATLLVDNNMCVWYNNCGGRIGFELRIWRETRKTIITVPGIDYVFNITKRKRPNNGCREKHSGASNQNKEYHESS